jgi:predicted Zn-dependent protease
MKRFVGIVAMVMVSASAHAVDLFDVIQSSVKFTSSAIKASKSLSPVQEYFLGRAVAAQVVLEMHQSRDAVLNAYVNKIGQTIVQASDRPETYGGYHFAVLENPAINAFACPGGFIFVTTGVLKAARNEDEVAAVIAHEVAHVANKHSLKAMKKAAWTGVALATVQDVAATYGNDVVQQINASFGNAVLDVTNMVLKSGFSRGDEKQADEKGMGYMTAAGYNPQAMIDFFEHMLELGNKGSKSIFATHAATDTRVRVAKDFMKKKNLSGTTVAARTTRFTQTVR